MSKQSSITEKFYYLSCKNKKSMTLKMEKIKPGLTELDNLKFEE